MTRYHFANQEKKEKVSRTRILITLFVVLIVVVAAVFLIAPLLRKLTRGPQWLATTLENQAGSTMSLLTPKKIILAENVKLHEKIRQYEAQAVKVSQITIENEQLRKELSYFPNNQQKIVLQVIGKPNRSLFNSIVIDGGLNQGVQIGQLVTAQHVYGVGIISAVTQTTATVELFAGPYFSGDVLLANKNIVVPASGKGSGNFEIHIPREVAVADGDLLAFPENPEVIVGVVKSIIFDPRDPFQTVLARLPVNVQELRFVEVVQ